MLQEGSKIEGCNAGVSGRTPGLQSAGQTKLLFCTTDPHHIPREALI